MNDLITAHNYNTKNSNVALPFFVLLTFAITMALLPVGTDGIEVRVSNLIIGKQKFSLINANKEDIYKVVYNSSNTTLNVTAWTNSSYRMPLLIVIRQENGLISLQLPDAKMGQHVQNLTRLLCPAYVGRDNQTGLSTVFIDIYTASPTNISYSLEVNYFAAFVLREPSSTSILVSPFAPVFFEYPMARGQSAILEFHAKDRICTTVSVQRMACPIFDLRHTVDFAGQYQTMTKTALISVDRQLQDNDEPVYIVISVHSNDLECCSTPNCSFSELHRIKNVTIDLKQGYDQSMVNLNYALTLSCFLALYILICPFLCFVEPYSEKNLKQLIHELKSAEVFASTSTNVASSNTPQSFQKTATTYMADMAMDTPPHHTNANEELLQHSHEAETDSDLNNTSVCLDSTLNNISSINSMRDAANLQDILPSCSSSGEDNLPVQSMQLQLQYQHKTIDRSESYTHHHKEQSSLVMLNEMATKQTKLVDRKMMNYPRLIIAIATFYTLPVLQLVFLYQTQLTKSGNEDSCYFNFLCMVKSGPFAAFNNIFSNVGYILLGIMFIIIVKKRAYSYAYMRKKYPKIMNQYGVPQHFGLFYTMGIGLIMEGILSSAYHVCPSYNNFQFDTSFMYIIGVISTLKLYQCRHPDIHVSSQKVFLFLALCILVNVVGVFYGKQHVWFIVLVSIFHLAFFFCLSVVLYKMKNPQLNLKKIRASLARQDNASIRNQLFSRPRRVERLVMLIIANIFNVCMATYAILIPTQFSTHLLHLLLGNFLLYFFMYCINKIINGERFHVVTLVNLVVAAIAWVFALYFFVIEIKHWEEKPSVSREANRPCILLKIYDHHDAWHFLSAFSMFLSFSVQLTLDDGLITKKRSEICVF